MYAPPNIVQGCTSFSFAPGPGPVKVAKKVKVVKKVKVRSCIGRPIQSGVRQGKWVKKVEVP